MLSARRTYSEDTAAQDFRHHPERIVRLNHQSFGAVPECVQEVHSRWRQEFLADPDLHLHPGIGNLKRELQRATASVVPLLTEVRGKAEPRSSAARTHAGGAISGASAVRERSPRRKAEAEREHEKHEGPQPPAVPTTQSENQEEAAAPHQNTLDGQLCVVENLTTACVIVANRWANLIRKDDATRPGTAARPPRLIFTLDVSYEPCVSALSHYCEGPCGARIVPLKVCQSADTTSERPNEVEAGRCEEPFEAWYPRSHEEVLRRIEPQVCEMRRHLDNYYASVSSLSNASSSGNCKAMVFAHLTHVACTPSMVLPVKQMLETIRDRYFPEEFVECMVDAAPSIGAVPHFDLQRDFGNPDWALMNLHKWAFAPLSVALMYARSTEVMKSTRHIVPGFDFGNGLVDEALSWTGTRDYTAILALPAAVDFVWNWRSRRGETAPEYCHRRVKEAASELSRAWGTQRFFESLGEEMSGCVATVRLPDAISKLFAGSADETRAALRERFNISASVCVAPTGCGAGLFVRLSFAVYNTQKDIDCLKDAIAALVASSESAEKHAVSTEA